MKGNGVHQPQTSLLHCSSEQVEMCQRGQLLHPLLHAKLHSPTNVWLPSLTKSIHPNNSTLNLHNLKSILKTNVLLASSPKQCFWYPLTKQTDCDDKLTNHLGSCGNIQWLVPSQSVCGSQCSAVGQACSHCTHLAVLFSRTSTSWISSEFPPWSAGVFSWVSTLPIRKPIRNSLPTASPLISCQPHQESESQVSSHLQILCPAPM